MIDNIIRAALLATPYLEAIREEVTKIPDHFGSALG